MVGSHSLHITFLVKCFKANSIVLVHLGEHNFEMPEVTPMEGMTTITRAHNPNYPVIQYWPCFLPP